MTTKTTNGTTSSITQKRFGRALAASLFIACAATWTQAAQAWPLLLELSEVSCTDGLDNDMDGQVDCEDSGCESFCYCSLPHALGLLDGDGECSMILECDEGYLDLDAVSANGCEYEVQPEHCFDRIDNDFDGLVDWRDPDCSAGV